MITPPDGWSLRRVGRVQLLTSPDAKLALAYREVVRPLAALDVLIDRELARDPSLSFCADAIGAPETLVTHEGEYAAHITIAGTIGAAPVQRDLGFVLTDDYYAALHGITDEPERFAELSEVVRALVQSDSHMLGIRRRRFRYRAPRAWTPAHDDFETSWVAPGGAAGLLVGAALPNAQPGVADQIACEVESSAMFAIVSKTGPHPLSLRSGLCGSLFDVIGTLPSGSLQRRTVALLQDDRYVYPLRLEAAGDGGGHVAAFFELLETIEPIPGPRGETPVVEPSLANFWAA